ncbi:Acetyltransferase (GNAT) domain-containing protein, partial [Pseudobutyrivibrio sp. ACV-2]
ELIVDYAFSHLSMHKIYLRVLSDNIRAYKSYEHAGFVKEGLFHDDVCIDGLYHDVIFMARYKD